MPLFIVSTPIGNPDDITLRAIQTLKDAEYLVCEELKIGRRLLKRLGIDKELMSLNEHNEKEHSEEIIQLLLTDKSVALFSDAGTPLFADPGIILVQRCHHLGIKVIPIPGVSSLTATLSVAGLDLKTFHYAGFLSRKPAERQNEIKNLGGMTCPVVILDTPYRMKAVLEDIKQVSGGQTPVTLALALTKPEELILKGPVSSVIKEVKNRNKKTEFVLILEAKAKRSSKKPYHKRRHKRQT